MEMLVKFYFWIFLLNVPDFRGVEMKFRVQRYLCLAQISFNDKVDRYNIDCTLYYRGYILELEMHNGLKKPDLYCTYAPNNSNDTIRVI